MTGWAPLGCPSSSNMRLSICLPLLFSGAIAGASWGGPYIDLNAELPVLEASERIENDRTVASVLAIVLGPFGAHRLYLGTTVKVAVIYGITFGGFGILPLLDLGHMIFNKDLEPYRNNGQVFMWTGKDLTPP